MAAGLWLEDPKFERNQIQNSKRHLEFWKNNTIRNFEKRFEDPKIVMMQRSNNDLLRWCDGVFNSHHVRIKFEWYS